jgi:glycosyltransferase involved in cell wall biosynthesis
MPQYEALEEQLRKKDVVIASGGPMLHPEFVRRLSTFNVWICGDDPESSEVLSRPAAPAFDYSFPINVACLEDYKRWGCERVDWIFHPIRAEMRAPELTEEAILSGQRDFDIVMFCERVLGLSDRAQRLEALSGAFPKAYLRGKGWPGGFISDAAMRDVYSRAKIGWNLHNSIGPCNTRLVTLPAFGIMQICDNKNHLGKVFELDKEVVGFDSIDECIDKTRYYLEHDEERRKIAAAGWARATRDYTWPKWWEWLETRIAGPAQAKLAKGGRKLAAMVPRLQPTRKLVENVTESISVSSKPEVVPVSKADLTPAPVATIPDLPVLAPDGTRPRVLMLVDKRGWAYDTAAQAISKRLADEFEFRIEYVREQPDLNAWPFDLIYVFFWGETYHQKFVKDPNRVIKEISSHRWANEDQYGRLTAEQAAQRYLSDAGTLTATSHRLRDIFSPYREVHWCPNGFEPANFQAPPLRTGPLRIGWAGNENDPCKGLKDVLKPAAGKDFELVIAGGDLDAARMGQFYNQIDVLCIASTAEGEPLTLVEGLASGCFPVSVDVGIVPELVHHGRNGLTVNRNAAAFQSAFQWCQLNVGEVRRAGEENARTMLTTRRWDDVSIHWRRALRSAYRRYSAVGLSGSGKSASADDKAFFERNLGVQLGQWPERAQAAAALIGRLGLGAGASVIDMGCGHQTLQGLISPSIRYVPVDRIARTPEVTVIDFNERLPEGGYTVATLLGVIEYFAQPERLLGWAAKHCQHLVLSYNDCSNPARRERQHWKSTLGFQELETTLTRLGGRVTERHDLGRAELIYSISFTPAARVTKKLALFSAGVNGDNSGDALIVDAIQRLLSPQAMEIFPLLEPLNEAQIDRINACDMGVICGTNLYQHDFHCELTPRVIEKIRVPILPLGIGTSAPIGLLPRMNAEGVRAVQMIHERCEVGSVRDPISLKFVESLGIKNVALTGCPVLFHALKEPVFEEASTDRLVVAVRARLLHVEEHWGAKQRHTLERLCREFRPALVLQSPYDVPIAEELAARFQLPILHDPRYTAKPMLEGVHRASRTIGFRLHFGMLTLAYGKPATLIATDTRTSEFCDMMGVAWHDIHSYKDESLIKELHEPQPGHERFLTRWRELRHAMKSALSANGLDTALE